MSFDMSMQGQIPLSAILIACAIAGCAPEPQGMPPTANEIVPATAEGLAEFLQRECIEQRNIDWVRAESERVRIAACDGFFASIWRSPGDYCEEASLTSWSVRTTDDSVLRIDMDWIADFPYPPRASRINCTAYVPETLGTAIQAAATTVAEGYPALAPSPQRSTHGPSEYWRWGPADQSQTTPFLELIHCVSCGGEDHWQFRMMHIYGERPQR